LAKKPFVVIDAEILSSSVWQEELHVKVVWLTLLILCDTEGYVGAALPGIASAAGVTLAQAEEALQKLQAPDPYSRTQENDGRRLEVAERGWRVLNFKAHIDRLSREREKARARLRQWRKRRKEKREGSASDRDGNVSVTPGNIPAPCSLLPASVEGNQRNQVPPTEGRRSAPPNPLMTDRVKTETEVLKLVREIADLAGLEPEEVLARGQEVPGKETGRRKLNPATMSDERLMNTRLDLRGWLADLKKQAAAKAEAEKKARVW